MTRFVDINAETAKINTSANPVALEDGDSFNLELEGSFSYPWLTAGNPYKGTKAIAMRLYPNIDGGKDRSELTVVHDGDSYEYHFGQVRYFGFAMMLNDSASDYPLNEWVHFAQFWQANAGSIGVPVVASLVPYTDPVQWRVVANDDLGGYFVVQPRPITRGVWHTFVFKVWANHNNMDGTGQVAVWHDGIQVGNVQRDVGITPSGIITDDWMVRCGLYRPINVDGVPQTLVASFDQIRWATTYPDVVA